MNHIQYYLDAKLNDIMFHNRLITEEEINLIIINEYQDDSNVHYKFNAGTGNTLYDHSGNGNHGTLMNMDDSSWVLNGCTDQCYDEYNPEAGVDDGSCETFVGCPDNGDYSLSFDGVDDYTILSNPITFGENSFSVSIDCYLNDFEGSDNEPYSYIVGTPLTGNTNDHGFKIETSSMAYNGGFNVHINDAGTSYFHVLRYDNEEQTNVVLNRWYNLTMVVNRSSNDFLFYVDGILVDSEIIDDNFGNVDLGVPIAIGVQSTHNTSLLNGSTDNLHIWNTPLTQDQVQSYMSTPPTGSEEGLVGYWKFNAGDGTTLYDHSGNGNHGTIYGARWITNGAKHVAEDGSDETGNGSVDSPFSSIQYAIDMSSDGDSVLVSAGTYYENINFNGKDIFLKGISGAETTLLLASNSTLPIFLFANWETENSIVDGFRLENTEIFGGAFKLQGHSKPIIRNCIIRHTISQHPVSFWHSGANFVNCIFSNNEGMSPIHFDANSLTPNIVNCTFVNNNAVDAGVAQINSPPVFKNCIMWGNSGGNAENIQGTALISYSIIEGGYEGIGNIDLNPQFTDPDNGDYTLQSSSPCIDTGDPDSDGDGEDYTTDTDDRDPDDTRIDMGAYPFFHIWGCIDESACSYDADANTDDGNCTYPNEDNCFCEFNKDCAGICGGTAIIDDCEYCTDGTTDLDYNYFLGCDDMCIGTQLDCAGECGGEAVVDDCGDCDGSNANMDACGVCNGDNTTCCLDDSADNYLEDGVCEYHYTIELHEGANLVSFWALPEDNSLDNMFIDLDGIITGVIGEGTAAIPDSVLGWAGSLTELICTSGYWIRVSESVIWNVVETELCPCDLVYEIQVGNNLVSWSSSSSCSVGEAIPDDFETYITGIIGEGVATVPNDLFGWLGSLSSLQPTKGYWLGSSIDMYYNWDACSCSGSFSRTAEAEIKINSEYFNQSTKQAFYFIESIENIEVGDWILAYNGDEVIGARQWTGSILDVPAMGNDGSLKQEIKNGN